VPELPVAERARGGLAMNILGMGTLEVLVILLVAFIVIGPEQMVVAARLLGKATREMGRLTAGLPDLMLDEELPETAARPDSMSGSAGTSVSPTGTAPEHAPDGEGVIDEEQGPVDFQPSRAPSTQDVSERPQADKT